MKNRIPPGTPPSQRGNRNERFITIAAPGTFKEKPILLTEPQMSDLAAYGPQMLSALREGWEQGLKEPCVLVIWRGSAYAREHGLDKASEPLVFRPISGEDLQRLSGSPSHPSNSAADMLPTYVFGLTKRTAIDVNVTIELSEDGALLAWRYSRKFRREWSPEFGEKLVRNAERITGVKRDD